MTARNVLTAVVLLALAVSVGLTAEDKPATTPTQKLAAEIPSVKLAKEPLMRVLNKYAELSGLKVEPDWEGLSAVSIAKDTPVTLQVEKQPLSKVLDLTLDSIAPKDSPLAWYLAGDTIHVSTQLRVVLRNRTWAPLPAAMDGPRPVAAGGGGGIREFNFSETPLGMAMDFLRDVSGQNFHVNWRSLEASGITKDTPITLKARGISVARALDLITGQLNVGRDRYASIYWIVEQGVVHVASGEALNKTTKVRIVEVGDLLMVVPNFKGPRIDLSAGTGNTTGNNGAGGGNNPLFGNAPAGGNQDNTEGEQSVEEQRKELRKGLVDTIKLSIGEDMWAPTGKGSITILRDKLIISQTPLGFKMLEQSFVR